MPGCGRRRSGLRAPAELRFPARTPGGRTVGGPSAERKASPRPVRWEVAALETTALRRPVLAVVEPHADSSVLPTPAGALRLAESVLAGWAPRAQQTSWGRLGPGRRWACEHVLGLAPLEPEKLPAAKVPHAAEEERNLAAAARYRKREGHLHVPRKHKRPLEPADGTAVEISPGLSIADSRNRRDSIPPPAPNASPNQGCAGRRTAGSGGMGPGSYGVPSSWRPIHSMMACSVRASASVGLNCSSSVPAST